MSRFWNPVLLTVALVAASFAHAGEPIPFRIAIRNDGDAPLQALRLRRPYRQRRRNGQGSVHSLPCPKRFD